MYMYLCPPSKFKIYNLTIGWSCWPPPPFHFSGKKSSIIHLIWFSLTLKLYHFLVTLIYQVTITCKNHVYGGIYTSAPSPTPIPLVTPTCKINDVIMQHNFVNMRPVDVNRQHNHVACWYIDLIYHVGDRRADRSTNLINLLV